MAIRRLDHVNFVSHDLPATIKFYCDIIGLVHGDNVSIDTARSIYLYIRGQDIAVLHIGDAKSSRQQPKFQRLADLAVNHTGEFSTGSFDHFCLLLDDNDYPLMIEKFEQHNLLYQTFCHEDIQLKQIWVLDPNGVRVELNFTP